MNRSYRAFIALLMVGLLAAAGSVSVLDGLGLLDALDAQGDRGTSREPSVLSVGAGGYRTITAAIEAAEPYDIVSVGAGVFSEAVVVDKPVTLIGMGPQTIFTSMYTVSSNDVLIQGHTFQDIVGGNWDTAGIITRTYFSYTVYRLTVKDCTFTGCRQGIFLFDAVNCVVDGCTFNNCTRGVTIRGHPWFGASTGNTIKNCRFYDQIPNGNWDGEAIAINGSGGAYTSDNYIQNCVMEGNGYGVHIDSSTGNEITDCTITNSTYEPLSFKYIGGALKVERNTIADNKGNVRFTSCAGYTFKSNTLRNNTGDLVMTLCTGFSFSDNSVRNNSGDVHLVSCSGYNLNANTINGSSVRLDSSTDGTHVANVFEPSDRLTFTFEPLQASFFDHTISTDNTVGGNPIHYLYNKMSPVIKDQTAGAIIFAFCSKPTVTGCKVQDGDGIRLVMSDEATINATVTDCLYGVLAVGSSSLKLERCTIDIAARGHGAVRTVGCDGTVHDSALVTGGTAVDWMLEGASSLSSYNTTFNGSRVNATTDSGGRLSVYNHLLVRVWDNGSAVPLPAVDVVLIQDGTPLYRTPHFGGTDARTDAKGEVGPFTLLDREYIYSNTATERGHNLSVRISIDAVWSETRPDLDMGASHTEVFEAADIRAPGTPGNLVVTDVPLEDALEVAWDANTDDTQVYSLYSNITGEWVLFQNLTAPTTVVRIDSGLVNFTAYHFRVSAWDEVPLQSPMSGIVSVIHLDAEGPSAPTGLIALIINGTSCTLGWDANVEPDIVGYHVYINVSGAGPEGPWYRLTPDGGTGPTSYWVTGLLSETDHHFRVTAFDESPNESPASLVLKVRTLDITPPLPPLLDALPAYTNRAHSNVTGSAEPGSTVTAFIGTDEAGSGTAGTDGRFTIDVELEDGSNVITAWATDASGNTGPLSPSVATILDTLAPPAPDLDALPALTNVPRQTVAGTAEAFSTLTVLGNGRPVGTGAVGADGAFSIEVTLEEGDNLLSAFATDRAMNAGPRTTVVKVVLDTIAPLAPDLRAPDEYVNDPELAMRGTAEPLSKVELLVGGVVIATTSADLGGAFTVTIDLSARRTEIVARATDAATNVGPGSAPVAVILDTELPVADAGVDLDGVEELEVTLDGSASTDNEGIASYTWTFRLDGQDVTLTGAIAAQTFPDPVTLTVTLVVRDLAGNTATDRLDVVIDRKNLPPALTEGAMAPEKGTTKTNFVFVVTLTDADDDNGTVYILIDGLRYSMTADPADPSSVDGRTYSYTTKLGLGPHTYYFEGEDDKGNVAGGASAGPGAQKTSQDVAKPKTVKTPGVGALAAVAGLCAVAGLLVASRRRR